ncbi:unnamed protein product [Ectocarpus fasciculatus]
MPSLHDYRSGRDEYLLHISGALDPVLQARLCPTDVLGRTGPKGSSWASDPGGASALPVHAGELGGAKGSDRHTHVAPKLPRNATVYIVAPHELFVPNLIPMTFFLLLLAFTDGTARTAEVLPRRALAQLAIAGDVLALDNNGVESYVYDSSLPVFQRTQRYQPGERQAARPSRKLTALSGDSGEDEGSTRKAAAVSSDAAAATRVSDSTTTARRAGRGGKGGAAERHRRRQLLHRQAPGGSGAVDTSHASSGNHLRAPERNDNWEDGEGTRRLTWAPLRDREIGGGVSRRGEEGWGREGPAGREAKVYGDGDTRVVFDVDVGGERTGEPPVGGEVAARRASGVSESLAAGTAAGQQLDDGSTAYRDAARTDGSGSGRDRSTEASTTAADPNAIDQAAGARLSRRGEAGAQQHDRRNDDADRAEYQYAAARAEAEEVQGPEFFPLPTPAGQRQQPSTRPCACARYIGEFGSAPVERGYWFREEKVENTRARIDALCGDVYRRRQEEQDAAEKEGGGGGDFGSRRRGQRLVIYQRNDNRRLLSLDDNVAVFQHLLGATWEVVQIVHDNAHEPCWLYSQLMDADMLLTPHGFQSMLLLFLPPGATILEVFPYKYWKEGYAPLAKEWGVRHEHIMSRPVSWEKRLALFFVPLERCMKSIHCRKWSRNADVRLEEHHLRQIAKAAKQASKRKREFLSPPAPPGQQRRGRQQ